MIGHTPEMVNRVCGMNIKISPENTILISDKITESDQS
tara:strand:+ start:320 stop:433 length:114 start_codon:yes stop_codon:yes gene_type:complete